MTDYQEVRAEGGFAYGVKGADIHVFGDGRPLYVLENWHPTPPEDPAELRKLPSRMLNARYAVVPFTGREDERAELSEWCQKGPRLAVRWLHSPGGQGKTRLAARIAAESLTDGWKVVTAIPSTAMLPPPGSQDLRLGDVAGLLMIIDYADRWPLTYLTWLFSNALLHQPATPTRVLLLARTDYAWPAVRSILENHHANVSQQLLGPLPAKPGFRERMFRTARDSFAFIYDIDPNTINSPDRLDHADFALTLAVHMAALVAVDTAAHPDDAHSKQMPADMAGLTTYLLDRECKHWNYLYSNRTRDKAAKDWEYQTPPSVMSRAVFTAVLTGPLDHLAGKVILDSLELELHSERVLTDHGFCYPPADPTRATVLEPLYPDRLAEDFLALTLPGHNANYPTYSWAPTTTMTLLAGGVNRASAGYVADAITILAAAAARWAHVGERYLFPLLRHDPQLAIDAGSAALTAIATLGNIPVLEAIKSLFPPKQHAELDVGIAVVTDVLTQHWLATTSDAATRAELCSNLGHRMANAGRYQEALTATADASDNYRQLAKNDFRYESLLAMALSNLGARLAEMGQRQQALAVGQKGKSA
jgi:hypothetical protein